MDKKIPIMIVALVLAVLALFLLSSNGGYVTTPECGDNFCASGENEDNCPDDCAEDDVGTLCDANEDCKSGVCNFIKKDTGECRSIDCEDGDYAVAIDGKIVFSCESGNWVEVDGPQTCKDNPYCGLQYPCEDPEDIRVLQADQYSEDCVESMAQMELPTVCVPCGNGVCDSEESECNCPEDCVAIDYNCRADSDCVSTCGAKCVNRNWAENYEDPCLNVRPWDCSCVEGLCYTDGNPPPEIKSLSERYQDLIDSCLEQYDDWFVAVEECIETSQVYNEYKAECEAKDGVFGQRGLYPIPYCNPLASDGGEECTDSSQCDGMCLSIDEPGATDVVGTCTDYVHVVGCVAPVENGTIPGILCID